MATCSRFFVLRSDQICSHLMKVCLSFLLFIYLFHIVRGQITVLASGENDLQPINRVLSFGYQFFRDDVSITYTVNDVPSALKVYDSGRIDYVLSMSTSSGNESASTVDWTLDFDDKIQVPIAANAFVPIARLPRGCNISSLAMDCETLGLLFSGRLTTWQELLSINFEVDELPTSCFGPIIVLYPSPDKYPDELESMSRSIARCSATFANVWRELEWDISLLDTFFSVTSAKKRLLFDDDDDDNDTSFGAFSMVQYCKLGDYIYSGLDGLPLVVSMCAPGNCTQNVSISESSVESALVHVVDKFVDGRITDAGRLHGGGIISGEPSLSQWPFVVLIYASFAGNYLGRVTSPGQGNSGDCSFIQEALRGISWSVVNDQHQRVIREYKFFSLPIPYKARAAQLSTRPTCHSAKAMINTYIVAIGEPITYIYNTMIASCTYGMNNFKFLPGSSQQAIASMPDKLDFAAVNLKPSRPQLMVMRGVMAIPMAFGCTVPIYNIPELHDKLPLVFDFSVLTGIYIGEVNRWNHPRVVALNPEYSQILPDAPIIVGYQTDQSANAIHYTTALSRANKTFAARYGPCDRIYFSDSYFGPSTIDGSDRNITEPAYLLPISGVQVPKAIDENSYSFTFWPTESIQGVANVIAGRMYNAAGNIVAADPTSLQSAVDDIGDNTDAEMMLLAPSAWSWPIVYINFFMIKSRTDFDCLKTKALVDWIYYVETAAVTKQIGLSKTIMLASMSKPFFRKLLLMTANVTCQGKVSLENSACFNALGDICSDHGKCTAGVCACEEGFTGNVCQLQPDSQASGEKNDNLGVILGAVLGGAVPVSLGFMAIIVICAFLLLKRYSDGGEEFLVAVDEPQLQEEIGEGGFGLVYNALWRGTYVAIKLFGPDKSSIKAAIVDIKRKQLSREEPCALGDRHELLDEQQTTVPLLPFACAAADDRIREVKKNDKKHMQEVERVFRKEMKAMSILRHPNVVTFMAAINDPPVFAIIMEKMDLGSLYDLLHNDQIAKIPMRLKINMALQAASGMNFLHQSNMIHGDLKSLNLLLNQRWILKVGDFGLSQFKNRMNGTQLYHKQAMGSVQWMAPEVLSDLDDVDYAKADVYSFAIVMWELLTRQVPYDGMTPAAIAVAVIRDERRPGIPASLGGDHGARDGHGQKGKERNSCTLFQEQEAFATDRYIKLMKLCWATDPSVRPTFGDIVQELTAMMSITDNEAECARSQKTEEHTADSSWDNSSSSTDVSLLTEELGQLCEPHSTKQIDCPTIVVADLPHAFEIWRDFDSCAVDIFNAINGVMYEEARDRQGFESVAIDQGKSVDGCKIFIFTRPEMALSWCDSVQRRLLQHEWPGELLEADYCCAHAGNYFDRRLTYSGPRVRMSVHRDYCQSMANQFNKMHHYFGHPVHYAAAMAQLASPGQVLVSQAVVNRLNEVHNGEHDWLAKLEQVPNIRMQLNHDGHFYAKERDHFEEDNSAGHGHHSDSDDPFTESPISKPHAVLDHIYNLTINGVGFRDFDFDPLFARAAQEGRCEDKKLPVVISPLESEDDYNYSKLKLRYGLGTAMKCKWLFGECALAVGQQVGKNIYGTLYKAKWRGLDVCLKVPPGASSDFSEREKLELLSDANRLSKLDHPNLTTFIGCSFESKIFIVSTWSGFTLDAMLARQMPANCQMALDFQTVLGILYNIAQGLEFLHSMPMMIKSASMVHGDLKPINIMLELIDENTVVAKLANFGFPKLKENNATMTQIEIPSWTSPEVMNNQMASSESDIYAVGIIMWQLVTHKRQPYEGMRMVDLINYVLSGRRPKIDENAMCHIPASYFKLMRKCWNTDPNARPSAAKLCHKLRETMKTNSHFDYDSNIL